MKVNNLLKRIGSVVTTAAMLATLGTTGFAYNPTNGITDSGTDITINSVSVVPVTGATDVYKVTAGYTAAKEQSVGVTMLTYAMTTRDANKSVSDVNITNVSTDGKVTSGAGENMPIIGIDQNAKTVENGTGTFEFTFTTNATNNSYYIAPGKTAIMFISGDNVSTKAAFSFNAPWTADTVDAVNFDTVNYTFGESDEAITTKVQTELNKHTSVTVKNSTDNNLSTTATAAYSNIALDKANNKATASVAYSNAAAPEAILNITTPTSVEVTLNGQKDTWTATNATVGKDNKISVAKGTTDIAAEIKKVGITIDNGATEGAKKTYKLSETEKNALAIAAKSGAENTYTVTINGTYGGDTQEITASNLIIEVTVEFTENIASAVELVNGNTESATAYTWSEDNVSVKADAETDAAVSTAVKNKLGADSVYAKITYTNANTSGGAAQYEYVSASDFAYVADVEKDKVTATVTKEGISITSGNTFDFGYTVTPVLTALNLSATTYNYTKKADVETEETIKANITTELDKFTITEDEHTVKVADTEHTWTITFGDNGTYTAILKVTKFNDTTFDAWMPTVGYIEATVTGTISEKPAEAFTAKSFGAVDKEVSVGTAKENVISSLPTTATAYENADKTGTSATVNVENWTSSDYDASKIGEYTFTATVPVQTQEGVVKVTEAGTVSVKVTTKAITVDATKTVTVNVPVGYTAETVANALPAKLTYTNDTLTDKVTVNWNAINADDLGKADGATFTVTGTVNDKSDSEIFIFNPKAVKATVTVRNSVESNKAWELGNTGEYNAGTVKVYLPTTAKQGNEVIATLYKANGETTGVEAKATLTSDYNADTYNSVDLTFDNSFNAVGINANDKYTVKVTVAGTPLVYKDAENNDADSVQGTVYPTTSRRPSTGGGSTTPEVKSYNVSVKADNNGKATVNKSKATAGETVAVNVEPNEGYKVKEITVKDVNGKSIDVDQKTRTFEMPAGAVTVTVTFEEGTEEPTPDDKGKFKDVPDSFWAAADIYTLREAGIIDGKTADEFDPEGQVTRAEFTKMIVKMFGVEAKDTKVEFADCGEDDWFTPFVAAAVEAGYVKGYSDTEFAPDKVISREEACAILGRAYAKAANSELSFTDKDSIDEYAQPYVALLVEMGFINGYEDGTFRAQNQITRAEAAKIIGCAYRLATASK